MVGFPLAAQKAHCGCGFIGPPVANELGVFKIATCLINASIFCFSATGALCADAKLGWIAANVAMQAKKR